MSLTRLNNARRISAASIATVAGTYTTHPEASGWKNRVEANGGSVSAGTLDAVSQFCTIIDANGLRSLFYRLNPFAGTGLSASLVPLYLGPTPLGRMYGSLTDTNTNFVSGDYSETSGIAGNGSTKYLNTGYPANTLAANNSHMGIGLLATETAAAGDRTAIGAWNGGANVLEIRARDRGGAVPLASAFTRYGTASDRFGDNVASGFLAVGNIVSAWPTMYRDGVASGTTATTSADFPSALNVYVFVLNQNATGTTNYSNVRLGWYSLGTTMTAGQVASFDVAIKAFYAKMGRS